MSTKINGNKVMMLISGATILARYSAHPAILRTSVAAFLTRSSATPASMAIAFPRDSAESTRYPLVAGIWFHVVSLFRRAAAVLGLRNSLVYALRDPGLKTLDLSCNAPHPVAPTISRKSPAGFWDSRRRGALKLSLDDVEWDRILACIGNGSIPTARGTKKAGFGAPGKSSRAIFAFYSPRPPLGSFTKEMG
jgi:hypothetical protein